MYPDKKNHLLTVCDNFAAFYSNTTHQTSIYDIEVWTNKNRSVVEAKPLAVIKGYVRTFIVHNKRMIIDNNVYSFTDEGIYLTQSLPEF